MTNQNHCLTLDIGTHSTRVAIIDSALNILWCEQFSYSLNHISATEIEQNADEILLGCRKTIDKALAQQFTVQCMAISCQRSSVVAWNKHTGEQVHPLLSWMDTRGHETVAQLKSREDSIQSISGLVLSAHYGATKLNWLKSVYGSNDDVLIGPLISFICFGLLCNTPFICDESNAGRTQCFDIHTRTWSDKLTQLFNVDKQSLPILVPTCGSIGQLKQNKSVSLLAMCGDQNAAFAQIQSQTYFNTQNTIAINFGTGAFLLAQSSKPQNIKGILNSLVWSDTQKAYYALEATVNGAGSALEWLVNEWVSDTKGYDTHLDIEATRDNFFTYFDSWLLQAFQDINQDYPIFINTLGGLAAPYWRTDIPTKFIGCDDNTPINDKAVAVSESILFLVRKNIEVLETVKPLTTLVVSGGLTKSATFCSMLSSITGKTVIVHNQKEASLVGAANLAFSSLSSLKNQGVNKNKSYIPINEKKNENAQLRYQRFITYIENY